MLQRAGQRPAAFIATGLPGIGWLLAFFVAPLSIILLYSFGENVSLTQVETTGGPSPGCCCSSCCRSGRIF